MLRFATIRLLLAALLVAGSVAGCSDDEGSSGPGPDASDQGDQADQPDTQQDPTADPVADPTQDPVADPTQDPVADPTEDPTEDPTQDPVADADAAGDGGDDAGDVGDAADVTDGGDGGVGVGVLLITEIVEGNLSGGLPKWVELTNVGDGPVALSDYSLGMFSNGNTALTRTVFNDPIPAIWAGVLGTGQLAPCESWVMNFETGDTIGDSGFFEVYGTDPDNFDFDSSFNGDDVIALFLGLPTAASGEGATLIDLIGTIGIDGGPPSDGDLQPWNYEDSFARRNADVIAALDLSGCSTLPGCSFDIAEWTFAGGNYMDNDGRNTAEAFAASTFPFQHTVDGCE